MTAVVVEPSTASAMPALLLPPVSVAVPVRAPKMVKVESLAAAVVATVTTVLRVRSSESSTVPVTR